MAIDLEWGLHGVLPDNPKRVWGARAIHHVQAKGFELLPDRQTKVNLDEEFVVWLNTVALPALRGRVTKWRGGSAVEEFALNTNTYHLRASTQASYGYVYITTWED